jgi:hypothetical protein
MFEFAFSFIGVCVAAILLVVVDDRRRVRAEDRAVKDRNTYVVNAQFRDERAFYMEKRRQARHASRGGRR